MLLAARRVLAERSLAALLERSGEETIRAITALVRAQVIDFLEVLAIDTGERDEFDDINRARRFFLERLQLLGGKDHVLILGELVALDGVVAGHDLVVLGADVLLLESVAALLV